MKEDVLTKLLASRDVASHAAATAREARASGSLTREILASCLTRYILAKYRLCEGDYDNLELDHLAEASLAKMLQLPPEEAQRLDGATCDGADSTHVKQALLMMSIQKDFDCTLDGFAVAFAKTVDDLAVLVFDGMEQAPRDANRGQGSL